MVFMRLAFPVLLPVLSNGQNSNFLLELHLYVQMKCFISNLLWLNSMGSCRGNKSFIITVRELTWAPCWGRCSVSAGSALGGLRQPEVWTLNSISQTHSPSGSKA